MKQISSDWLYYQTLIQHPNLLNPQKRSVFYYFFALVLAVTGSWLLLFMLGIQGLYPFRPHSPTSLEDQLATAFTPSVSYWSEEILSWSDAWGLDPILVATVMQIESCGDPGVISPAGARGLFQVMPYHFEQNENPLDPDTNAKRGLAYLSQSFTLSNGNLELTLAGYNGGHGQIGRQKFLWPDETQGYVRWGSAIYNEVMAGVTPSKTLSNWLEAGGWRLCQEAEERLSLQ